MSSIKVSGDKHVEELSYTFLVVTVLSTLGALFAVLWLLPHGWIWDYQVNASVGYILKAIFICVIATGCKEFFFHRYFLHRPLLPGKFFAKLYKQHHIVHHGHTRISIMPTKNGKKMYCVVNRFPIDKPEQKEASFFPWFSMIVFCLIDTPVLAVLQWLFPKFPWFFVGYSANAFGLILYEVIHAIEHWPREWWISKIEHPRWGGFWTKVYGFHFYHHAVTNCNEAISGVCGFPLWDLIFGTMKLPDTIYADGDEVDMKKFPEPTPCALIRWLDDWTKKIVDNRRAQVT